MTGNPSDNVASQPRIAMMAGKAGTPFLRETRF
jgi:hypothetical protein